MHDYELTASPFHLLRVSVRSNRDEIADAYDDALVDGIHDEELLLQAHQALVGPKTRLEAEIAWFPDCSPSHSRRLMEALEKADNIPYAIKGIHEFWKARRQPADLARKPAGKKVGRNEPCPCGSGRKYKRCCGAN